MDRMSKIRAVVFGVSAISAISLTTYVSQANAAAADVVASQLLLSISPSPSPSISTSASPSPFERISPSIISASPSAISVSPSAISASPSAISVSPSAISVSPSVSQ
jgi:hypothetical protein